MVCDVQDSISLFNIITKSASFWGFGFGLGLAFSIAYYYLSKMLNEAEIEKKAFLSLISVFETLGIVVLLILAESFFSIFLTTYAGFSCFVPDIHIRLAEYALTKYYNAIEVRYLYAYLTESLMATLFSVEIPLASIGGAEGKHVSFSPAYPFHAFIQYQSQLVEYLVYLFMGVITRAYLINLSYYLTALLLPIGLFFRFFSPTRKFGSGIIALVIVLYYVFPFSVLFTDKLITLYKPEWNIVNNAKELNIAFYPESDEAIKAYQQEALIFESAIKDANELEKTENEIENETKAKGYLPQMFSSIFKESISYKDVAVSLGLVTFTVAKESLMEKIISRLPGFGKKAKAFLDVLALPLSLYFGLIASKILMKIFLSLFIQQLIMVTNMAVVIFISLVLEITISITAYKELSSYLGGDALLFALSRLV